MQNLIKLPLIFLFIASMIGLVLRWHSYHPISGFIYPFWLHAHSHVMFLGWVLNALFLGFIICLLPERSHRWYKWPLYIINLLVLGMLFTFPLQGYGVHSIIISTLHTVAVVIVCFRFFKDTKHDKAKNAIWLARISLLFFLIAALGPFVVGFLVANGLGQTNGYHLAVYYYLHFQYNGVFTFGILALLFHWLEHIGCSLNLILVKRFRIILFITCFPAYALSTLWANPPTIIYWVGFLAALAQLIALYYLLVALQGHWIKLKQATLPNSRLLLIASLLAFAIKLVLQLVSAHPYIAIVAYEVRFYVIAYLHLVLIGVMSFFLLAWYNDQGWISIRRTYAYLLLIGFVASELIMISVGQWPHLFNVSKWLVISSAILVLGIGGITYQAFFVKVIKY